MFDVGFSIASLTPSIMFYMQMGIRSSDGINKSMHRGFSDLSLPYSRISFTSFYLVELHGDWLIGPTKAENAIGDWSFDIWNV